MGGTGWPSRPAPSDGRRRVPPIRSGTAGNLAERCASDDGVAPGFTLATWPEATSSRRPVARPSPPPAHHRDLSDGHRRAVAGLVVRPQHHRVSAVGHVTELEGLHRAPRRRRGPLDGPRRPVRPRRLVSEALYQTSLVVVDEAVVAVITRGDEAQTQGAPAV